MLTYEGILEIAQAARNGLLHLVEDDMTEREQTLSAMVAVLSAMVCSKHFDYELYGSIAAYAMTGDATELIRLYRSPRTDLRKEYVA